jgi:hypothetical protein
VAHRRSCGSKIGVETERHIRWQLPQGGVVLDLPSMRTHAAAFLSDIEAKPDSPDAGVARAAGVTCWFAGDYREAREHLERALALFRPGRDDDLAFRFGLDPGVAAMFYLALVSWPLGEVDRAISLIDRMQTRIADLTLAVGKTFAALFELMRGDHARAAANAFELARLVREHELPMWGAMGVFLRGWAASRSGAPADGLGDMRRGVELLREQKVLWFDGLLKIALAEAETRAGDPDRAVAILDEALATCDRTGCRAFEAELHSAGRLGSPRAFVTPPHFLGAMDLDNRGVRLVVRQDSSSGRYPPPTTSKAAIWNVRFTATPAVRCASIAADRRCPLRSKFRPPNRSTSEFRPDRIGETDLQTPAMD